MASEQVAPSVRRLVDILGETQGYTTLEEGTMLPVSVIMEDLRYGVAAIKHGLLDPKEVLVHLGELAASPQPLAATKVAEVYDIIRGGPDQADARALLPLGSSDEFMRLLSRSAAKLPSNLVECICTDFLQHAPTAACLAVARALRHPAHQQAITTALGELVRHEGFTQYRELTQLLDTSDSTAHPVLRTALQLAMASEDQQWVLEQLLAALAAGFQPGPQLWLDLAQALWPKDGQTPPEAWLQPVVLSSMVRQLLGRPEAEQIVLDALAAAVWHRLVLPEDTLVEVLEHCGQGPGSPRAAKLGLALSALRCALLATGGPSPKVCELVVAIHNLLPAVMPSPTVVHQQSVPHAQPSCIDAVAATGGSEKQEQDPFVAGDGNSAVAAVDDVAAACDSTAAASAAVHAEADEPGSPNAVEPFARQVLQTLHAAPTGSSSAASASMMLACSRQGSPRLLVALLRSMQTARVPLAPGAAEAVLRQASPPLPAPLATAVFEHSTAAQPALAVEFSDEGLLLVLKAYQAQGNGGAAFELALALRSAVARLRVLKGLQPGLAAPGQASALFLAMLGAAVDAEDAMEAARLLREPPAGISKESHVPASASSSPRDASQLWHNASLLLANAGNLAAANVAASTAAQHAKDTGVPSRHDWLQVLLLACRADCRGRGEGEDLLPRLCRDAASAGLLRSPAGERKLADEAARHGRYVVVLESLQRSQADADTLRQWLKELLPSIAWRNPSLGLVDLLAFVSMHEKGWNEALKNSHILRPALGACHAAQRWDLAEALYSTLKSSVGKSLVGVEARSWGLEAMVREGLMDKAAGVVNTWALRDWPDPKVYLDTMEAGAAYALARCHAGHEEDAVKVLRQVVRRHQAPLPAWAHAGYYTTAVGCPRPDKALALAHQMEDALREGQGRGVQADVTVTAAHLQLCAAASDVRGVGKLLLDYTRPAAQAARHGCDEAAAERHQVVFASALHALYCLERGHVLPEVLEAMYSCGVRQITSALLLQATWLALTQPSVLAASSDVENRVESAWAELGNSLLVALASAGEEGGEQEAERDSARQPWGTRELLKVMQHNSTAGVAVDLVPQQGNRLSWDRVERVLSGLA